MPLQWLYHRTITSTVVLLSVGCLWLCWNRASEPSATLQSNESNTAASMLSHCPHPRPTRYLISLSPNAPHHAKHYDDISQLLNTPHANIVKHTWNIGSFKGYSLEFTDVEQCEKFWKSFNDGHWKDVVDAVEVDCHAGINIQAVQAEAPWGLDRIDQKEYPLNGAYNYLDSAGEGVDIYIVDTGININHKDFEGRASWGTTTRTDDAPDYDDNGHGSHVAGIAGGKTYGAAKKAHLIAVKALDADGRGPYSEFIDGLQWVATNAPQTGRKTVVNLSIQGQVSDALNRAATGLVDLGFHVVGATGNHGEDACEFSPAVIAPNSSIISVGATDDEDQVAEFSNYGDCVSLVAPGVNIVSVDFETNDGTVAMSGTSMAAPHVSGTIAVLLSAAENNTSIPTDPAGMKKFLLDGAVMDVTAADGTADDTVGVMYNGQ